MERKQDCLGNIEISWKPMVLSEMGSDSFIWETRESPSEEEREGHTYVTFTDKQLC